MSIARPTAIIRRAAALPIGFLDRIDAHLDAGFTHVDSLVTRGIQSTTGLTTSLTQGLATRTQATDQVLDQSLANSDAKTKFRIAKFHTRAGNLASVTQNLEARLDARLVRNLHTADRISAIVASTIQSIVPASVRSTERIENKITRGFNRVDTRATNVANRAHRRKLKTLDLAHRSATRIDQRIQADFNRADVRIDAGIGHAIAATETAVVHFVAATNSTDTRLANALTRIDARVANRFNQLSQAASTTVNLVNTKAAAFERTMELGITRIDTRVERRVNQAVVAKNAAIASVNATDQSLDRGLARIDHKVNYRVAQGAYAYSTATTAATNRIAAIDAGLTARLTTTDTRIDTAVSTIISATKGITPFMADRIEDVDASLAKVLSRIDARVDAFVSETNGQPTHAGRRASAAPPWVATSLALVLGTLGAATGASALSASDVPVEIDTSVKIEAGAAKDAVTQYLNVRESFQALQADRSRTIQTLQEEIAAAEIRANQASLNGKAVVDIANDYGGIPYVRGGSTPKGFDCSGYTSYVFAQLGVSLPRTAQGQYSFTERVSASDRKVGDLMFWQGRSGVYHVGIYAGGGKMWDSPYPGRRVGKVGIWGSPTYGRVPASAINGPALREIEKKTAELDSLLENVPQLPITIDENYLPTSD
jgi:cell wall-associated NlpC family hydrolase